jgi:hypothetical protein
LFYSITGLDFGCKPVLEDKQDDINDPADTENPTRKEIKKSQQRIAEIEAVDA